MGRVLAYDQFNGSTFTGGVFNAPAGTTLLKARLTAFTWMATHNTTVTYQGAPPNTLLGISWVAHGTVVPLVDTTNWKTSTWYIAGPGELDNYDSFANLDRGQTPPFLYRENVYANHIELDVPLFESAAFDLGISLNFQGGGFWTNANPWVSYQFVAYFD